MKDAEELIQRIRNRDSSAIKELYIMLRPMFINYFKTYSLVEEDLKDLFQEVMVIIYNHIMEGKYSESKSKITTYTLSIGRFKVIDHLKKVKKQQEINELIKNDEPIIETQLEQELTFEQKALKQQFLKLGKRCKKVLTLFYYRGLTLSEIVIMENYKDVNTVKSQKSRCLKQLKELVKEEL